MLDKTQFLNEYTVSKELEASGLEWSELEKIYDDYVAHESEIEQCLKDLQKYIVENLKAPVHSVRCRKKDARHLIEKIIRKCGKEQSSKYQHISVSNYQEIVRDLVGIRILVLTKEEWEPVYDNIMELFVNSQDEKVKLAEKPVAYTIYGDRDIFKDRIHREYSNKGYRSQHYVVKFQGHYCEIQVRTLAEEVYGEFDHKVKYPYRDNNKFLVRYTKTLSQLLDSVDEIISTCFQMGETGWNRCDEYYQEDRYIDWQNSSQKIISGNQENMRKKHSDVEENIMSYINNIILRKDQQNGKCDK